MWPGWVVEVQATRRILKNVRWTPWAPRRAPIAAVFQEFQLELEDLQDIAVVLCHTCHTESDCHGYLPAPRFAKTTLRLPWLASRVRVIKITVRTGHAPRASQSWLERLHRLFDETSMGKSSGV